MDGTHESSYAANVLKAKMNSWTSYFRQKLSNGWNILVKANWLWSIPVVVVVYLSIVIASGLGWNPFGEPWNFSNPGAFGDSFGPLSTIMAAFAAISAWMAYQAQKQELDRVKSDSEKERTSAERRDFEATFFRLLELFQNTVEALRSTDVYGQNPANGRQALGLILESHLQGRKGQVSDKKLYENVYGEFRDQLGHYFRTLYHIVNFVDKSKVENKKMYIRFLRATLSNAEIVLLGLNCLHGGGRLKFKKLVEKHALLHNISSTYAYNWDLVSQYSQKAFGARKISEQGRIASEWPD